jgi:hypothetical protein
VGGDGQLPLEFKNEFEKFLCMELGALPYFSSNLFWFATSLSLLGMFYVGYRFTGMTDGGKMGQNVNFASTENKLKLLSTFLVLEVVLNLGLVAGFSALA